METKSFNKESLKALRIDIDNALKEVAKKHGLLELYIKNISFSDNDFRTTLIGKTKNREKSNQKAIELFKMYVGQDIFGKKFVHKGVEYMVSDFNTRKRKNPIICVSTGDEHRQVSGSVEAIKNALKIK